MLADFTIDLEPDRPRSSRGHMINFGRDYDPWFENSSEIPFYKMDEAMAFECTIAEIDKHYLAKFGKARTQL